jgi:hypothetical protein
MTMGGRHTSPFLQVNVFLTVSVTVPFMIKGLGGT